MDGAESPIGPASCMTDEERATTEKGYRFVAPEAGLYRATVSDEYGEPLGLALFDAACLEELECAPGEEEGEATLDFEASVGEELILLVSGLNYPSEAYYPILDVELLDMP